MGARRPRFAATPPTSSPTVALAHIRGTLGALAAEVDRLRADEAFQHILEVMAKFWRYSWFNQWLIAAQRPAASRVAGRRLWESLGRTVKPGERAIEIFAPTRGGFPFLVVPVFDIRQTSGRRVPDLEISLKGRTSHATSLERAADKLGVRLTEIKGMDPAVGRSLGGEIQIRAGISERERTAVLAHELAHELLHRDDRGSFSEIERETEAEATSFVVLRALGLPSKAPSYIAWRGGSGTLIAKSLKRIQQAAKQILEAAEPRSGEAAS